MSAFMTRSRIRGPPRATRLCLNTRSQRIGSLPRPPGATEDRPEPADPLLPKAASNPGPSPLPSRPTHRPIRRRRQSSVLSIPLPCRARSTSLPAWPLRKFDRCVYRRATVSYRRNRDRVVFQQYGGAIGASRAEAMPDASSGAVEERSGAVTRKQNGAYRGDVRPRAAPPPRTGPALLLCPEISISVNRTSGETNGYDHGLDGSR